MSGFKPSAYQEAIFNFMRTGRGDGIVNAVAGSGKSTTLQKGAGVIRGEALMLAFNKHIAESLAAKLRGTSTTAKTIHSVGFACVTQALSSKRRVQVKSSKYAGITREYMKAYEKEFQNWGQDFGTLRKLVDFVRLTLTDFHDVEAVQAMCDRYNINWEPRFHQPMKDILRVGNDNADNNAEIDFTDMIYLPHRLKLSPPPFDWLLVDECQDLNTAQRQLVLKMRGRGGRMLFVGDPYQAIMMFAGADAASYWTIKDVTGATQLPLSICYRCPRSHVELAQALVPEIEPAPNAAEGEIVFADETQLPQLVRVPDRGAADDELDLILCRRNAPLIKHCLRMIQKRLPARIRGRDVAKELCDLIRDLGEEAKDFSKFPDAVELYRDSQVKKLDARSASESAYDVLADKCEAVLACYEGFKAVDHEDLARQVEELFADDHASIWLSSIHRAKGLEARRVFVLESAVLGTPRPKQSPEEIQQELNLKYVALTRAKETLFLM